MDILEQPHLNISYLDEELGLFRPQLDKSVVGILPEMMSLWNNDRIKNVDSTNWVCYPRLQKKLIEAHPSGFDNILLILIDGFGIENIQSSSSLILNNIVNQQGEIAYSTFPTMTSTVMTSIMYGSHPSTHGIVGYNIYNEKLDKAWNTLRLRYLDDNMRERVVLNDVSLSDLVSGNSITTAIDDLQTPITYLVPKYLRPPGLGNILNPTFRQTGYHDHQDAIFQVKQLLQDDSQQSFVALYFPDPDLYAHKFGPNSAEFHQSVKTVEQTINRVMDLQEVKNKSTLVLVTSDHGLVGVNKSQLPLMSTEKWRDYATQGTLLSSSGRTVHAYARDGNLEKTRKLLETLVDPKKSLIIDNKEAIDLQGGNTRFNSRIGDFLVLAADDYLLHVPNSLDTDHVDMNLGQHGSLSSAELFVPVSILSEGN